MEHSREHEHRPRSGADDWDDLYRSYEGTRWSERPNPALVAEVTGLIPARAIDVGCGEGADAIWLASRGWDVTGLDISFVAIERAKQGADAAGVAVDWVCADLVSDSPTDDAFNLVTTHYPALLRSAMDESIAALLRGVAPGGTLLFVTHALTEPDVARSHGFEPDDYLQPGDLLAHLDDEWVIEVNETRERVGGSSPHSEDHILRVRRSS